MYDLRLHLLHSVRLYFKDYVENKCLADIYN
jgi:hypothetical protein